MNVVILYIEDVDLNFQASVGIGVLLRVILYIEDVDLNMNPSPSYSGGAVILYIEDVDLNILFDIHIYDCTSSSSTLRMWI